MFIRGFIAVVVALGVLAGTGMGMKAYWDSQAPKYKEVQARDYVGQVYLEQEEYTEFKKMLAGRQDVVINDMNVLSSRDPLVAFDVTVKGDGTFPYGSLEKVTYRCESGCAGGAMVGMGFGGVIGAVVVLAVVLKGLEKVRLPRRVRVVDDEHMPID